MTKLIASRRLPSLPFSLLLLLIAALWVAGGASRADVMAQLVVRGAAWGLLIIAILGGVKAVDLRGQPLFWFLLAMVALVAAQLIPLPPEIWTQLAGREILAATPLQPLPWRPLSMAPSATINALSSLIIPVTGLFLLSALPHKEARRLPALLLAAISAAMALGLLQFAGLKLAHPFIPDFNAVSGIFANRNHFALFLAIGCMIAPVWAFSSTAHRAWRAATALALILLFTLSILATGSRMGIALLCIALPLALALSWSDIRSSLRQAPRWALPALIGTAAVLVIGLAALSIAADRAESIRRIFALQAGEDMRARALPTVLDMVGAYFPIGSGFGSFDPVFRLHEPLELLKLTYFNHAHNDFLEVVLTGGLPALILLVAALGYYLHASYRVWGPSSDGRLRPKLGSAILLLILIASAFDYPARTPMIMMVIMMAASWLQRGAGRPALPQ